MADSEQSMVVVKGTTYSLEVFRVIRTQRQQRAVATYPKMTECDGQSTLELNWKTELTDCDSGKSDSSYTTANLRAMRNRNKMGRENAQRRQGIWAEIH